MKPSWKHTRFWQRLVSGLLTVVMLVGLLPTTALAALLDNSPAYNQEILSQLEQIVGSEEEAQAYYEILQRYNLLDEDGNAVTSWKIRMDGKDLTLDQLREVLAGDYDPGYYITVDGTPITLGDVSTILEIEDYLAYLRETYFDGRQWTAEQQENLRSLMSQVDQEGIMLQSAGGDLTGSSGVNHAARVSVTGPTVTGGTATYTAVLTNAAEDQTVTFHWAAQSGSQPVSGGGDVTLTAAQPEAELKVTLNPVTTDTVRCTADLTYYLKLDGITNALFSNHAPALSVLCRTDQTMNDVPTGSFQFSGTTTVVNKGEDSWGPIQENTPATVSPTQAQRNAIAWGIADTAAISTTHATDASSLLVYRENNTFVDVYRIEMSATAGGDTLASASYSQNVDDKGTDFVYAKDEQNRVNQSLPNKDIGNQITLNSNSGYHWYQKLNGSWATTATFVYIPITIKLTFSDTKAPAYVSASAPTDTYYPGQVVPVTITFSEPVDLSSVQVKFNGENDVVFPAVTSGYSNVVTVPYTVKDVDNNNLSISSVSARDGSGHTLSAYNPGGSTTTGKPVAGVVLETPRKTDAVASVSARVTGTAAAPELVVDVAISSNGEMTQWLGAAMEQADGRWQTKVDSLSVSLDGGVTRYPLVFAGENVTGQTGTATIPLEINNSGSAVTYVAELYIEKKLVVGKAASAEQQAAKYITEQDLTASVTIGQYEFENPQDPTIYVQSDMPDIQASFTLTGADYTYGDTSSTAVAGTPEAETADFVWSTSDPSVAAIDKNGRITPTGKAGATAVTLTARNGGIDGKAVTVTAQYTVETQVYTDLKFAAGLAPFLQIPQKELSSGDGQPAMVYWTSNLCEKNADTDTVFSVTVTRGAQEVYTTTVTGTAEEPAGSVTIPGDVLQYDYSGGSNAFTVTVSATYGGQIYSDTATISLEAQPARVSLGKLNSYYITDQTNTVSIAWNVENLDLRGDAQENDIFRFQITRDNDLVDTSAVTLGQGTGDGSYSGTYTLNIADVAANEDPASYRQVYTVTLQAKNGEDSTWSYDSFLLYVYDADALRIMVNGAEAGSSLTMSNRDTISGMSQEQILALKRDIYLKDVISANYGQYAWTEVADQIAWASSDNDVASINYQQGTLYEDIRNFPYVSYRPTEDFVLSGKSDGETTITATHKLTGMSDSLNVTVETLKDKLYLFQCYPQATTTLTFQEYTSAARTATKEVTITSDDQGAAAYYAEYGIASDVYCQSTDSDGNLYVGTFYRSDLKTGEQDAATMVLYPCNNLQLRRAAYAYVYLKKPDGTPYTGDIIFRGGVYVNGEYKENALFQLNGEGNVSRPGNQDQVVSLGEDGKLTVVMDQSQWGLPNNALTIQDQVEYVFQIEREDSIEYYPLLMTIDATTNSDAYVNSGEATVNFRANSEKAEHPFVIQQISTMKNYGTPSSLLDYTGKVGPSDSCPEVELSTIVMWWGKTKEDAKDGTLNLQTKGGTEVAPTQSYQDNETYPFSDSVFTYYTVPLNQDTMDQSQGGLLEMGTSTAVFLEYYDSSNKLARREELPFQLCNMLGVGKIENQQEISDMLNTLGKNMDISAESNMNFGDQFVQVALNLVADDSYVTDDSKFFSIQLAPTSDPTKFLGFIEVNLGNMENNVTGVYADSENRDVDFSYGPGLSETMMLTKLKTPMQYAMGQMDDFFKVVKRKPVRNISFQLGGYAESLIYFNENTGKWEIQILNGGFNTGGGLSYTWNWNTWVGPVPFTTSLSIGGTAEVNMDALTVSYWEETKEDYYTSNLGNDFLTELRIYLYLRAFAGVGFDYSILAFKLGIYGQINLDMQFQWLNRPYMDSDNKVINAADGMSNQDAAGNGITYNLNGQSFKIDGQIGLEFLVKFLFISYEKVLYSYNFNLLDQKTGDWNTIQTSWTANQEAMQDAIAGLLNSKNATLTNMGGQQMLSLELAPTMENRDYLTDGNFYRQWGQGGANTLALDPEGDQGLKNLESSTYPYADPMVSDDGSLVVYLSDMGSTDPADTQAVYATRNGSTYVKGGSIDSGKGFGDSQLSLSGTENFAVAAWSRQTESVNKDEGAVITTDDQMVMMNSAEVCAAVYTGGRWTTTQLSSNASPDLAPVSATNGEKAIVFWRAVSSSGANGAVTTFDQKDTIVYRIYDGETWSDIQTLYNGTSGNVKGITAAMLDDGTAAVAYTLSTSADITTQEIVYAVVNTDSGEVVRNVQATNDGYLDENPQLAAVKFGDDQRFVLGWYTEQAVSTDSAKVLDSGSETGSGTETVSDIRLLDFDSLGVSGQLLPDSISQAADAYGVSITSDFRFTKNADSIEDLSILWVERAQGTTAVLGDGSGSQGEENTDLSSLSTEKDVLKGVKFYKSENTVRFTGAIDIAEMGEATLIDHFDAYVSNSAANEVKAVILGTTYGADGGTTTRTVTLADGVTQAQVTVPTRTSAMYTATETYQDKIEVPALLADYETIYPGSVTQIQFTVENQGIHVIDSLTIQVGETVTQLDTVILPGQSVPVTADYLVPESGVVDPQYTVTAHFTDEGAAGTAKSGTQTATGTVYLDLPNLQITEAKILNEENGIRTIQVKLNNTLAASLNKNNRFVRISFYSDVTCQTPIDSLTPITIRDADDLAMIDEGGYSTQVDFNVGEYVKKDDGTVQEIPDSGVTVYIKVEIVETENGEDTVQGEPTTSDNYAAVTCENLKNRTGQEAILTTTLSNEGGKSTVTVDLQNTSLTQTATGNLVVTLLDEQGRVLEQKQSYTGTGGDNGLITLTGEEKAQKTFSFDVTGTDVQVTYSNLILNTASAELTNLTFSSIPGITLDSFVYNEETGRYEYTVDTDDLTATTVMASTRSATAKAVVTTQTAPFSNNGAGSNALSQTVTLMPGQVNTITVSVTDGPEQQTYVLTIRNNGDPDMNWGDGDEDAAQVGYSTEVYYAGDNAVINLRAVESGDYTMTYQWYRCDVNGDNTELLADETASTLTLPNTTDAGTYYYRCKVTRNLVDGGTKDYWSSVATVQIKKATDNSVTLTSTDVVFDNQPHGLTAAEAAKTGSTLHYSTDGGNTWSQTAPTFTAAGVYTVWVYATNPNYEDSDIVTADVVIRENEGIQFKLEMVPVAESFAQYPQQIREQYTDAAGVEAALKEELTALGVSKDDMQICDVKLLFSLDDGETWSEATADNFPAASVTVDMPYPESTDRYYYDFTILHMITEPLDTGKTVGDIETMDITMEEDGIRFTADCLSPFAVGWIFHSSASSYPVSVRDSDHGSVSVTPTRAKYGTTVTIQAEPEEGYEVDTVQVVTSGGRNITATKTGSDTYTFTMPRSAVSVKVIFTQPDTWTNPFSDVSDSAWYYDAVQYVSKNGMMSGYGANLFGPDDTLTRSQLAQVLYNLEGKPSLEGENLGYPFADVQGDAWFADAVYWARLHGIVTGYSDGQFGPSDNITREQLAVMLYRYAQYKGYDVTAEGSLTSFPDEKDVASWSKTAVTWAVSHGLIAGTGQGTLDPQGNASRAEVATILMRFCQNLVK